MSYIFETERLLVRKLIFDDFMPFHEMQSDVEVMKFVKPKVLDIEGNKEDLSKLVSSYNDVKNDFLIYAVVEKVSDDFVGSVALVKDDNNDDEIGYRFLKKYWNKGFGKEIVNGLISYCRNANFEKLVAYVAKENLASIKIVEQADFTFETEQFCEELNLIENKYTLFL